MYPGKAEGASWVFPTVESTNSHGKKTFWIITVTAVSEGNDIIVADLLDNKPLPASYSATIKVDSGIVNGAIRKTPITKVVSGKNQGKKNETNVFCQAMNDARGKYNNQMRKAKVPLLYAGAALYPPMLAKDYKDDMIFPCSVQRKYDGLRVVATLAYTDGAPTGVILYSRSRDIYLGLPNHRKAIFDLLVASKGTLYLDGEMYAHGQSLQVISGWVRHETTPPAADILQFMVYDCFCGESQDTYLVRKNLLENCFAQCAPSKYCSLVETFTAPDVIEARRLYQDFLAEGYEGAMLRTDTPYIFSYNSLHCGNLLKMKPAFDAEFEVVGWTVSKQGKTDGAFMVMCKTSAGIVFDITPAMTILDRIALATQMQSVELNQQTYFENHLLGKMITVKFGALSDTGVPLRASTKLAVRYD